MVDVSGQKTIFAKKNHGWEDGDRNSVHFIEFRILNKRIDELEGEQTGPGSAKETRSGCRFTLIKSQDGGQRADVRLLFF